MARAVLFDLDGTLVDHIGAARAAVAAWASAHAPDDGRDLFVEWLRLEGEHFSAYLRGECSFPDQRRRRMLGLRAFLDRDAGPDEDLDRDFSDYLTAYEAAWRCYPDAPPALGQLRSLGWSLGVLTNGQREQQVSKLERTGLLPLIDVVVATSELVATKPDRRAFLAACDRLGHAPESVVYVGDDLATDAQAATAAGLRGIWLDRTGTGITWSGPTAGSLSDLPPLLTHT